MPDDFSFTTTNWSQRRSYSVRSPPSPNGAPPIQWSSTPVNAKRHSSPQTPMRRTCNTQTLPTTPASSSRSVHADNLAPPGSQDDTAFYLSFIRRLNARFIIYSDGSATARTLNGGAGMVVTEGDLANPTTLLTKQQHDEGKEASNYRLCSPTILHQSPLHGVAFTPSFAQKAATMQLALEWATTNRPEYSLTMCPDSQ